MAGKKILIVDDNVVNLEMINEVLVSAGYFVIRATKGMDAIKIAKEINPDLILLDIMMPDIDGGEVAHMLKSDFETSNIPIIFLSSLITRKEEKYGSKRDGIYFMAKPYDRDNLLKEIRKHL